MISFGKLLEFDNINKNEEKYEMIDIQEKIPWIEKYRPTTLDEIIYQDEVTKMLKKTLVNGNLPHLLFHGPAGSGKTSCILAIATELFGPKKFNDRVIELNASDERGINVVRNKIVTFAKTSIGTPDPNYPSPPYKIIILDEADAMTTDAQSALRKTMEDNSHITRFCFICNYINQIIEPITSRCVKFRFKSLNNKCMIKKLEFISLKENMELNNNILENIAEISEGDMRKAIMFLQNLKYIKIYKNITEHDVFELAGYLQQDIKEKLKLVCRKNTNIDTSNIIKLAKNIISSSYPMDIVLKEINEMIIKETTISDKIKSKICLHFSKTEKRLIDGANEYLQLLSCLMFIRIIIEEKIEF